MNYNAALRRSPTLFGSNNCRGGSYCCVPGCTNSSTDNKTSLRKRSFYRMPLKDDHRMRLWLANIKRSNWAPSASTRICSAHFEGGKKTNEVDTAGYVPTIFPTRVLSRKSLPSVYSVPRSPMSASSPQDTDGPGRGTKKRQLVDVEPDVRIFNPHHYQRDHTYSTCLPVVLDEKTAESVQWDQAWKGFFISNCEASDEPSSTNCEQTDSDNVSADEFIVIIDEFHHFKYDPNDNLDDFVAGIVHHRKCQNFSALRTDLMLHMDKFDKDGFAIVKCSKDGINIAQFYDGDVAAVKLSIAISPSFSARVYVHRQTIGMGHGLWSDLPKYFSSVSDVERLLSKLCNYRICVGNYEDEFSSLVSHNAGSSQGRSHNAGTSQGRSHKAGSSQGRSHKAGSSHGRSHKAGSSQGRSHKDGSSPGRSHGTAEAYKEGDFGARDNGVQYSSTIRSTSCQLLVHGQQRCSHCRSHRHILQELSRRADPSDQTSKPTVGNKRRKSVPKVVHVDTSKGKRRKNTAQVELERPRRATRRK